jgi:hypothetical protein
MSKGQDRGRLDWLVELAGALAPALAAGFAAWRLAPMLGWPGPASLLASSGGMFALAFAAMRVVPAEPRHLPLLGFALAEVEEGDVLLLDQPLIAAEMDELLLDQPLAEAASGEIAELLLEDRLPEPAPDSRVVQLFAGGRMPTAGQLQQRIDRHLAAGGRPAEPDGDASDALSAALAELRHSLRQA